MISLLIVLRHFVRVLRTAWRDPAFRVLAGITAALLALGSLFYHFVEGWSLLDSAYFSLVTLATVGYGDFTPKTTLGKLFTMMYLLLGIGVLVAVFTQLARAVISDVPAARPTGRPRRVRPRRRHRPAQRDTGPMPAVPPPADRADQ